MQNEGITTLAADLAAELATQSSAGPAQPAISFLSVAQKLQLLAVDGHLPVETRCLQCELATSQVLQCYIECELPRVQSQVRFWDRMAAVALLFVSPLHGLFHVATATADEPAIVSDEVVVRAPLRLCPECAQRLQHDRRRVRELLQRMPLYQPLFREYPAATINIARQRS